VEVGIIEREEWRSVETSSGGECVMIGGVPMTLLLYAANLDFQKKVFHVNV
jgi:pyruvate/2-oxoglutarate dehydrogenase complex dihydrolipoamide dehydrogenase (E3) component